MRFNVMGKDWKESWAQPEYRKHAQWCQDQGLEHIQELSGNDFGIDSDILLHTDEPVDDNQTEELVQVGYFGVSEFEEEELRETSGVVSLFEREEEGCRVLEIEFQSGEKHVFIYPKERS